MERAARQRSAAAPAANKESVIAIIIISGSEEQQSEGLALAQVTATPREENFSVVCWPIKATRLD